LTPKAAQTRWSQAGWIQVACMAFEDGSSKPRSWCARTLHRVSDNYCVHIDERWLLLINDGRSTAGWLHSFVWLMLARVNSKHITLQAMMLVTECAASVPAFWQSQRLRTAVPEALLHCLAAQPPRLLRLSVHHAFIPLVKSCPKERAQGWLGVTMQRLMEVLPDKLGSMWAELKAKVSGQVGEAKSKQTEDEIIQEVRS
jgi:Exportin-5 family